MYFRWPFRDKNSDLPPAAAALPDVGAAFSRFAFPRTPGAVLSVHYPSDLGNLMVIVVPSFGIEFRSTVALCSIAACLTIDKPNPVPPISRDLPLSTR